MNDVEGDLAGVENVLEGGDALIRHIPQQDRARRTVEKLEHGIRTVLRDPSLGRDRFTTAQVAEAAGVSIGTAYRYFKDRTEMLDHIWPDRAETYLPEQEKTSAPGAGSG